MLVLSAGSSNIKFAADRKVDEGLCSTYDGQVKSMDGAPHFVGRDEQEVVGADVRWRSSD